MYLNSISIIGFLGKDPERRQVRGNGVAYTVLSVATQHSWKNARDEWQSKTDWHRVVLWNNRVAFAERLHAGDHILVGGTLVSSTYEREIGKGKKAATLKLTSWSIRANVVRKLNRAEKEPEAVSTASGDRPIAAKIQSSTDAPF
jgi:single-strand DNA-binding protein